MLTTDLLKWAQKIKKDLKEKRQVTTQLPRLGKIDAYIDMIIARGEYLVSTAIKGQKYTEEIEDALVRLSDYGVSVPGRPKEEINIKENPLRP